MIEEKDLLAYQLQEKLHKIIIELIKIDPNIALAVLTSGIHFTIENTIQPDHYKDAINDLCKMLEDHLINKVPTELK